MNRRLLVFGAIGLIMTIIVTVIAIGFYALINKDIGISAPKDWLTHKFAGISFAYPAEFELRPNNAILLSNRADEENARVDLTLTGLFQSEKYDNASEFCSSITQYYRDLEANLPSSQSPFGNNSKPTQGSDDKIKVQNLEVMQINGKQVCGFELQGLTEETSSLVYSFFVNGGGKVNVLQAIVSYGKDASKNDIDKMRQVVTTLRAENEFQLPELQFPAI